MILRESIDPGLERYLIGLADKAQGGDLKGAVFGLVRGEYATEAREYVFERCQVIDWKRYPTLYMSGVKTVIPKKMPSFFGLAGAAAKVTAWLMKNYDDPQFRQELKQAVIDNLPRRSVA